MLGDGLAVRLRGGGEQFFGDLAVEEAFGQAVGAEQKEVAGLEINRAHLRTYELVIRAESLLQGGAAGVVPGFALGDLPVAAQPAYMGVIVADLAQRAVPLSRGNRCGCLRCGQSRATRRSASRG